MLVSETYADVDGSNDPIEAIADQERVDGWPQIRAYKERTYELLAGASPVLDVGCGTGLDVVALGAGAVGVDRSRGMALTAAGRGAAVACADGLALPVADRACGGVRADRVVQHVADPIAAVREMVRVCRPGGRIVVADPDQETLTIHVPGVRPELADAVKQRRRDVGYRNGRVVATLPHRFRQLGLVDVTVDAFPLVLTDPADAFGLPQWPRLWGFPPADVDEWESAIDGASIVYALLYLVVSGRRPEVAQP